VNGSEITKEHLLERAELIRTQLPAGSAGADFYARVLENMVGAELLSQSATKNGFMPSDEELEAELSNQSVRFGGLEAFRSALEQQGLSLEDARSDLRRDMGIQRLIDEKIGAAVLVTEEEKQSFYDENQEAMQSPERFKVAHILIGVEDSATTEEKAAARKKAESIRSMVDAGQDFADLARRNSDDPGSKDTGGELPMMRRGETVAPFEAAALTLAPGELSDVVETQYGYHVIKMVERHEAGTSSYEEVQERIGQFLHQRQLQQRIEEEVQRLRQEGEVEVFL
jgi:peptidyl-prolyl cis-trans isomerase C